MQQECNTIQGIRRRKLELVAIANPVILINAVRNRIPYIMHDLCQSNISDQHLAQLLGNDSEYRRPSDFRPVGKDAP